MAKKILTSTRSAADGNLPYYHLPKGMLKLTVTQSGTLFEPTSSVVVLPDPDHRYFLRYNANSFTYDKINVSFTKEGFLKEISTTIKDETGDVIRSIADIGAEAAKAVAGVASTRSMDQAGARVVYEHTFDPFDEESLNQVNEELKIVKADFTVSVNPMGKSEESQKGVPDRSNRFGVYCRPIAPFEIVFRGSNWLKRELLSFPHPDVINFVEVPTASFAESTFTMSFGFDDDPLYVGYPNQISVDNPSSALAIIRVPLDILKALVSIPAQIFQLKFDITNRRTEAAAQERMLAEELKNKEMSEKKTRSELEKFRREHERAREVFKKEQEEADQKHKKDLLKAESRIDSMRRELEDLKG